MSTHCPWNGFPQSPLGFCEEVLCTWFKQPGNTWTNIGYFVVAFAVWRIGSKAPGPLRNTLLVVAVLTGIGSSMFHATGTHVGAMTDYVGMLSGTAALTALNFGRWRATSDRAIYGVFAVTLAMLIASLIIFHDHPRLVYLFGSPCCLLEFALFIRDRRKIRYRWYLIAWGTILIATVFWWLDESRIWCDPSNHFVSGHGIWHLLTAISLYFFYEFYATNS